MTLHMYVFAREKNFQSCYSLFRLAYFQSEIKWKFVGFHASKYLYFERLPACPQRVSRQRNHTRASHGFLQFTTPPISLALLTNFTGQDVS